MNRRIRVTAVVDDDAVLIEAFIVDDEPVGAGKRVIMKIAAHFQLRLHLLAAMNWIPHLTPASGSRLIRFFYYEDQALQIKKAGRLHPAS